ncbi:MAG: hypothetical protein ACYTGC_08420, partial [Planctomycetota bacterium]
MEVVGTQHEEPLPEPAAEAEPDGGSIDRAAILRDLTKTYFKPDGSVLVQALDGVTLQIQHG